MVVQGSARSPRTRSWSRTNHTGVAGAKPATFGVLPSGVRVPSVGPRGLGTGRVGALTMTLVEDDDVVEQLPRTLPIQRSATPLCHGLLHAVLAG